ncbi:MAG: 50S ribosomal protein L11 methyltransferase, partial [Pseudomonadota bacterium]
RALSDARRPAARCRDGFEGTGVLAIAALKTGSRSAIGTDIDADSVAIARENAEKNAAAGAFKAITATGCRSSRVRQGAPYDLVFANILARPLVRLAPDIRKVTRPGGTIILSGLLTHQEPQVRRAYEGQGLCLIDRLHKDVWSTLVYRKQTIR